jgi:gas vesicle protein
MRRFCKRLAFFMAGGILLGTCAILSAADKSKVSEMAPPTKSEEQMQRLIGRLGSERFTDREHATEELSKLGKSTLSSLKEAVKSPEAEVRRRAQQLIERMKSPPVPIDPKSYL